MSAFHWENNNGSEALNCPPGNLGCLLSRRLIRTNQTDILEQWYSQGTCTLTTCTWGAVHSYPKLLLHHHSSLELLPITDTSLLYHLMWSNGHFCYLRCTYTILSSEVTHILGDDSKDSCILWLALGQRKRTSQLEKSTFFFSFCQVNIFKLCNLNFLPHQMPFHSIWLIKHFSICFCLCNLPIYMTFLKASEATLKLSSVTSAWIFIHPFKSPPILEC